MRVVQFGIILAAALLSSSPALAVPAVIPSPLFEGVLPGEVRTALVNDDVAHAAQLLGLSRADSPTTGEASGGGGKEGEQFSTAASSPPGQDAQNLPYVFYCEDEDYGGECQFGIMADNTLKTCYPVSDALNDKSVPSLPLSPPPSLPPDPSTPSLLTGVGDADGCIGKTGLQATRSRTGVVGSIATAAASSGCLPPRTAVMGLPSPFFPISVLFCRRSAVTDDGNVHRKLTGDHNDAISSYKCNYNCEGV